MYQNSLALSVFLAKFLGLYLAIYCIGILLNRERYDKIRDEVLIQPVFLLLSGVLALLLALPIVLSHNLWTRDWRVLITILGWLLLIKGILRTVFPNTVLKVFDFLGENFEFVLTTAAAVLLMLGLYLTYKGFSVAVF